MCPKGWLNAYGTEINSYSFQTYIHEIGHALGLRHGGNYNGSATYGVHNHYLNDSWQATVMSYFSQTENTYINASYAYVITPMVADIIAVQDLYGTPTNIRTGATVYGNNSNAGGYLETFFDSNQTAAMTVYDNGGTDLFDFSLRWRQSTHRSQPGSHFRCRRADRQPDRCARNRSLKMQMGAAATTT